MKTRILFTLFVLSLLQSGCMSLDSVNDKWAKLKHQLTPPGPPAQILAVWDQGVRVVGDKSERGFAGRVYFYPTNQRKPVKCDGHVIVYAFDEKGRDVGDNKPTRSYVFSPEELKRCYSKSKMGHSYSLWIPWDTDGPGGESREISLMVKHSPEVGSALVSSQAKVYLLGRDVNPALLAAKNSSNNIQQTSYEQMIEPSSRSTSIQTHTITRSARGMEVSREPAVREPVERPALSEGVVPAVAARVETPPLAASPSPTWGPTLPPLTD